MAELPAKQLMYVVYPDGVRSVLIVARGVPAGYVFPPGQKPKDPYIVVDQKTAQTYVVDMKDLWASPRDAEIAWAEDWEGEPEALAANPAEDEEVDVDLCEECGHPVDEHEDGCLITSCDCEESFEDEWEEEEE